MKEENKIRTLGLTAFFMGVVAFFLYCFLVSCCTPIHHVYNETFSSSEYREAKIITATIVWIDSIRRVDNLVGGYRLVGRIYWEDSNNIKWVSESIWPCPFKVGQWIPLLLKR